MKNVEHKKENQKEDESDLGKDNRVTYSCIASPPSEALVASSPSLGRHFKFDS